MNDELEFIWDSYGSGGWWMRGGRHVSDDDPELCALSNDERKELMEAAKFFPCPHCGEPIPYEFM